MSNSSDGMPRAQRVAISKNPIMSLDHVLNQMVGQSQLMN